MGEQDFYVTTMPPSRPADYYLGYLEGSVFLDFDNVDGKKICLKRISFDGYGCCELVGAIPLNENDSSIFKDLVLDEVKDQMALMTIIRNTIALNKSVLWTDALEEYGLI